MATIVQTTNQSQELTVMIDAAQSVPTNITYIGKAKLGTATSDAGWQILRIEQSTDGITTVLYANGSNRWNQVWDDRESLTYSN